MFKAIRALVRFIFLLWGIAGYLVLVLVGYVAVTTVLTKIDSTAHQAQIVAGTVGIFVVNMWLRWWLFGLVLGRKHRKLRSWKPLPLSVFVRPIFAVGLSFFLFSLAYPQVAETYAAFLKHVKEDFLVSIIDPSLIFTTVIFGTILLIILPIAYGLEYVERRYGKSKQQKMKKIFFLAGLAPWVLLFIVFWSPIGHSLDVLQGEYLNARIAAVNFFVGVLWIGWAYELFTGSILAFVSTQAQKTLSARIFAHKNKTSQM